MGHTSRRLRAGAVELAVLEAGVGGAPLLLVHGFTGGAVDFADHLDDLAAAGWHAVAPDLRGHGASDAPPDEADYSFELLAGDVLALADALGWDRFTLLGHSMGGMVAQHVALAAPDRLTGLVLMDTGHGPVDVPRGDAEAAVALVRSQGIDALADVLLASPDGPLETPAARRVREERPGWVELNDGKLRDTSPALYAAMLETMLDADDRLDRLAALAVPTLVMVGEQDQPFLGPSQRMAATIPGADLVVIPDAGHSPQVEAPAVWFEVLTGFLAGVGGAAPELAGNVFEAGT